MAPKLPIVRQNRPGYDRPGADRPGPPVNPFKHWNRPPSVGFIELKEARNRVGRALFPNDWTGEEWKRPYRVAWGDTVWNEAEAAFWRDHHRRCIEKRCEIAGVAFTIGPDGEFPRISFDTLPALTREIIKAIDQEMAPAREKVRAIVGRRHAVTEKFHKWIVRGLLEASIKGHDGKLVSLPADFMDDDHGPPDEDGLSPDGIEKFNRGFVDGPECRSIGRESAVILIEEDQLTGLIDAITVEAGATSAPPTGSEVGGEGQPKMLHGTDRLSFRSAGSAPTSEAEADRFGKEPDLTHSGMAGRPSAKHLYLDELERRGGQGQLCDSVAAQSRDLHDWLRREHPTTPPGTPKTIENNIRGLYRELKTANPPK